MSPLIGVFFSASAGAAPARSPAQPPDPGCIVAGLGGRARRRRFGRARRLAADARGATIVEFAFVAPILMLTLMGIFDLGYKSYVAAVVQGALHDAARMGTVGDKTTAQIDAAVNARLLAFSRGSTITITHKSYSDFSGVKIPETITSDTAPVGQYNAGDCYEDYNNNNTYDTDRGKSGQGNSEDVVNYEISITYPRLFPVTKLMGLPATETVKASTVLRNQPYGSRSTAAVTIRC
jgi:Flp pilus assembly protein TadG